MTSWWRLPLDREEPRRRVTYRHNVWWIHPPARQSCNSRFGILRRLVPFRRK